MDEINMESLVHPFYYIFVANSYHWEHLIRSPKNVPNKYTLKSICIYFQYYFFHVKTQVCYDTHKLQLVWEMRTYSTRVLRFSSIKQLFIDIFCLKDIHYVYETALLLPVYEILITSCQLHSNYASVHISINLIFHRNHHLGCLLYLGNLANSKTPGKFLSNLENFRFEIQI